jgi:hypothetical protein
MEIVLVGIIVITFQEFDSGGDYGSFALSLMWVTLLYPSLTVNKKLLVLQIKKKKNSNKFQFSLFSILV